MGRSGDRPEHTAPPDVFYDDVEARKYTTNSRIMNIQTQLTERAMELLALPEDGQPRLLLDLGCGSGLSGETLTERGHYWTGFDISMSMLEVAKERETEGDLCRKDLGQGLGLRPGCYDGAISISALQWLCNAETSQQNPKLRLKCLFDSLYKCLARGARAVFQMYPENAVQAEMITVTAMKSGFTGGVVVDFPQSSKAKKHYLVLMTSSAGVPQLPQALEDEHMGQVKVYERTSAKGKRRKDGGHGGHGGSKRHPQAKGRDWILKKKALRRKRGYMDVQPDTKYTGRKRRNLSNF
ncbi:S-adenosyl-l-methionine-dependent methyltransferase [Chloropicon primus]|uniref:S-adenosyl-l-methionine-dependent methyltransferase n=1 Tax=Chloropicon primus TaxID=1764295 RepID=A0A5B8MTU2_9CHLO|nr:S-adenosyl-l-methionine-dependent methyltransferase [Chloropicon primus]UPR02980.1 S-adenosyl-l-methionine-dependent methyltransferase [Chloropicon primus]|mmetsp:Transcript_12525/g.34915  ORF Transcript_12525/g.34915 Transcript_12525/m.34915 type:complete len:296 (+) Transcript_12525:183-1070(+)|eukprot:QDZ23767.1 S-adenosyl-l-methionine-dependent methyltransferase [Chloropicon primus]